MAAKAARKRHEETYAVRLLSPPAYWQGLTTGLRIEEFRHLARVIDRVRETRSYAPNSVDALSPENESGDDQNLVANALRHAANVQDRLGPPLTEHAQRRMRAAIRARSGGRQMPVAHPLVHLARHAALYSPWPSLRVVRTSVQCLMSLTSVDLPHRTAGFWRVRKRAYQLLDIALGIADAEERKAAIRILGPMMLDAGHLAGGILWDLEHLAPEGSWYCSDPARPLSAVRAPGLVPPKPRGSSGP